MTLTAFLRVSTSKSAPNDLTEYPIALSTLLFQPAANASLSKSRTALTHSSTGGFSVLLGTKRHLQHLLTAILRSAIRPFARPCHPNLWLTRTSQSQRIFLSSSNEKHHMRPYLALGTPPKNTLRFFFARRPLHCQSHSCFALLSPGPTLPSLLSLRTVFHRTGLRHTPGHTPSLSISDTARTRLVFHLTEIVSFLCELLRVLCSISKPPSRLQTLSLTFRYIFQPSPGLSFRPLCVPPQFSVRTSVLFLTHSSFCFVNTWT